MQNKRISIIKIILSITFCVGVSFCAMANTLKDCDKLLKAGSEAYHDGDFYKALEFYTEAKLIAEKNDLQEQLFDANHQLGLIYYNLLDYAEAMQYYLAAYTIATENRAASKEMLMLNNIGILYALEKDYKKGEDYFQRAFNIAKDEKDITKMGHYAINLAWLSNQSSDFEKAKKHLEEAFQLLKNEKETLLYQQARLTLAENFLKSGEFEPAREILEDLVQNPHIISFKKDFIETQYFLASVYTGLNQLDKANFYANKALEENTSYSSRILIFEKLAEINFKSKNFSKAVQFKDSVIANKDAWEAVKQEKLYENSKIKFEIQDHINRLKNNQEKLKAERKLFGSIIFLGVILCFLIFRFFRIKFIKEKQKKVIAEREQEIISLELENEKKEHLLLENQVKEIETKARLEQELLKNEIEQKNRTLSAKALYLSGRNEMIEEIVNSLSSIPEVSENKEVKNNLKTLTSHIKTDCEWESFFSHFEEVNPGLLAALKERHPKLTPNDVRFLCYVYMNLSTKEICLIFNITPEASRKRKERIAKKMELKDSGSLYSYISSIGQLGYQLE